MRLKVFYNGGWIVGRHFCPCTVQYTLIYTASNFKPNQAWSQAKAGLTLGVVIGYENRKHPIEDIRLEMFASGDNTQPTQSKSVVISNIEPKSSIGLGITSDPSWEIAVKGSILGKSEDQAQMLVVFWGTATGI